MTTKEIVKALTFLGVKLCEYKNKEIVGVSEHSVYVFNQSLVLETYSTLSKLMIKQIQSFYYDKAGLLVIDTDGYGSVRMPCKPDITFENIRRYGDENMVIIDILPF